MFHPMAGFLKLGSVRRFLFWQFKSRLRNRVFIHKWLYPALFYVYRSETGLTGNVYVGLHEFEDMGFLLHCLKADDIFVDIGANSGSYTLLASAVIGARSISIEPVSSTFERLSRNILLNGIENKVKALKVGLSDTKGSLNITNTADSMNHLTINTPEGSTERVAISTLDDVLLGQLPRLIKIDVEGWEGQVLAGGRLTLRKSSLLALIVELNGSSYKFGVSENSIMQLLSDEGFVPVSYNPLDRSIEFLSQKSLTKANTLFIRNFEEVSNRIKNAPKRTLHGLTF